jgi:hypothetical protein
MNIEEQLMGEMSRRNVEHVANYIGNDASRFNELVGLIFMQKDKLSLRATWALTVVTDKYPEIIQPHTGKIIGSLETFEHTGIHRMLLRSLQDAILTEDEEGMLYTICFNWLTSAHEPPAVRALSMLQLYKTAKKEPDLMRELLLIIEDLADHESAAIRSVCKQVLKSVKR